MTIPSIVSSSDALRQRRQLEDELRVAATVARARQHWSDQWRRESIQISTGSSVPAPAPRAAGLGRAVPMMATPAPVSAIYQSVNNDTYWGTLSLGGLRRDKIVLYSHAAAMAIHLILLTITIVVAASSNADPNLSIWRQRFIFTYNSSVCGRNSDFTGQPEIVAVLVPTGNNFNVAVASGGFFFLSALFHSLWVIGMTVYEPLGRLLLGWLAAAFAPLRWLEYSASAALMMAVLTVISGGRNQTDLASIWMLMSTTMAMGVSPALTLTLPPNPNPDPTPNPRQFLTEIGSRPDESSNGERWQGELQDKSNRFSCYVRRMAPHIVGFFPYFSAWAILYSIYTTTLNDIEEAFPQIDEAIPSYIIAALTSTFAIFSSFTATQIVAQWRRPGNYWATEPTYALLSMTSKVVLGAILIANLLGRDAQEGSAGGNDD